MDYKNDYQKYDSDGTLYLVLGIIEAVLCNLIIGGAAAIFGYLGMDEAKKERYDIADNRFRVSKILLIVGLVIGIFRAILAVVLYLFYGVVIHNILQMIF